MARLNLSCLRSVHSASIAEQLAEHLKAKDMIMSLQLIISENAKDALTKCEESEEAKRKADAEKKNLKPRQADAKRRI